MKKICLGLLISFFLICISPLFAEDTGILIGKVIDEDDRPIPYANVKLKQTNIGVMSDEMGNFKIKNIPAGTYSVISQLMGYMQTTIDSIQIKANETTELEIYLVSRWRRNAKLTYVQDELYIKQKDKHFKTNSTLFKNTVNDPVSSFPFTSETVTYSYLKRFLKHNQPLDQNYIRAEELINAIDYDYPDPSGEEIISSSFELGACPWNTDHDLLRIALKSKKIPYEQRPSANLIFLIDQSGSMLKDDKYLLIRETLKSCISLLSPSDLIGIVTFDSQAKIALAPTLVSQEQEIQKLIDNLSFGGISDGEEGLNLAYKLIEKDLDKSKNNRIILCSDGNFNNGSSSEAMIKELMQKSNSSVNLSFFGFGVSADKLKKLDVFVNKNVKFYSIDDINGAVKALNQEINDSNNLIAKDVSIDVSFNPALVSSYRIIAYDDDHENCVNTHMSSEDIFADQSVTVLYEIVRNSTLNNNSDESNRSSISIRPNTFQSNELMRLKMNYKLPADSTSKEIIYTFNDIKTEPNTSDFLFASSVAGFSLLLRNDSDSKNLSWQNIIELAWKALGNNKDPRKEEMISLMEKAKQLSLSE